MYIYSIVFVFVFVIVVALVCLDFFRQVKYVILITIKVERSIEQLTATILQYTTITKYDCVFDSIMCPQLFSFQTDFYCLLLA